MSDPANRPAADAAPDASATREAALAEAQRDPALRWLLPLGVVLGAVLSATTTWLGNLLGNNVGGL